MDLINKLVGGQGCTADGAAAARNPLARLVDSVLDTAPVCRGCLNHPRVVFFHPITSPYPFLPRPIPFVSPPFLLTPHIHLTHPYLPPPLSFVPAITPPIQMPDGAIRDAGAHSGPMAAGLQAGLYEGGEAMLHHYHPHHHHHPPHGPPPPPPLMVIGRGRGRGRESRGGDPWAQEFMQMPPDAR